jgi:hypothetical protein
MQTKTHQDLQPKNTKLNTSLFCNFSNVILNGEFLVVDFILFYYYYNFFLGEKHLWWNFFSLIIWMREKEFESLNPSYVCNPPHFTG